MPKRPITPDDLWRVRRVGQPVPIPGGDAAVVGVTTYDVERNTGMTRLYRVDAGGGARPLTRAGADSTAPAVDPAGSRIAFTRTTGEDEPAQVWVMALDGGEAQQVTDLPLGAVAPKWLPDGSGILVWSPLYEGHLDVDATRAERTARKDRKVSAETTESRIYRYWNRWLTRGEVHHLFRVDPDGGPPTDLTPRWTRLVEFEEIGDVFDISPDGAQIAFHAALVDAPFDELRFGIYTLVIDGGDPVPLDPDGPAFQGRPRYSPDGAAIVYGVRFDWPGFYADRTRLVSYDRTSGDRTIRIGDWDRSPTGWEFAADGTLVFSAEDDARRHLYALDPGDDAPTQIAAGGWVHGPRPADGGRVWCRSETMSRPAEISVCEPGTGLRVVSGFNDDLLDEIGLGEVADERFVGADGDEVQMWVVYPPGFDAARRWPLVHNIHGGPHGVTGDLWHPRWNMHAFAAGGYVVAGVNFHGSSSWGNRFARSIQGAWGDKPTTDILMATDHLLAHGYIDADRMAIAGGSYGGYLVSWLIGHSDRFAAAVCHAGVTNLLGQYATDITHGREGSFGAEPWTDLEAVRRWSPTDFTSEMNTPTLVIHGERDYRVVITQGLELYALLKARGVEARLVYYPDEGHWILKPQNSLHWYGEVADWLERHLGRPIAPPQDDTEP